MPCPSDIVSIAHPADNVKRFLNIFLKKCTRPNGRDLQFREGAFPVSVGIVPRRSVRGTAVAVLGIFTPALERSYQVLHGHSSDLTPSAGPPCPPGSINISHSGQIVKHFFQKKFFIFFTKKS